MMVKQQGESRKDRRKRFIREAEIDIAKGINLSSLSGMSMYVQGLTYLDCSLYFDMRQDEFCRELSTRTEKIRRAWFSDGSEAGGFPAHAVRCAAPKGVKIFLGGCIPKSLPPPIERFIEENNLDTSYVRLVEEPIAKSLKIRFKDGNHCYIIDRGQAAFGDPIPDAPFDVILLNPGSTKERRSVMEQLCNTILRRRPETVVGLIARSDWTEDDWTMVKGTNSRVYLNERELADSVALQFPQETSSQPEANLALLRSKTGTSLVVTTTLGEKGSLLMNHVPYLARCTAPRVPVVRCGGSGDTFATTATLSAADGASDCICCHRANMEAARFVAGESISSSFGELDAEILKHSEIVETHIPL